jgi:DNA-binding ferritin-like protein (Dps family)
VLEFIAYLERERNKLIRDELQRLITVTNLKKDISEFVRAVRNLLKGYASDFVIIQRQLSDYYYTHMNKNKLIEDISLTIYEFDRITLNKLREVPLEETKIMLRKLCLEFVVEKEFDTTAVVFPNIYLPCSVQNEAYCNNGKLMLNTPLDQFIEILSSDIKDSLRVRYLLSGVFADTTLSYLQFIIVPTEIIIIYRISE